MVAGGQDMSAFNRHMSVDSVNSYNSLTAGSQQMTTAAFTDAGADKKKKRRNWVRWTWFQRGFQPTQRK